jgi:hypothetical protein
MVHFQKLVAPCGEDGAELAYAIEVVRRLACIFKAQLAFDQSIALMHMLQLYTLIYDDGFVINDEYGIIETIGLSDAATFISAFWEEPEKDWEWWRQMYWSYDKSTPIYQAHFQAVLMQIRSAAGLRVREAGMR